jgi:hypothetical protein
MYNTMKNPKTNPIGWTAADLNRSFKPKLVLPGLFLAALFVGMTASVNAQTIWYSGQRAFGQATVEPAVDLATGNEIFLLTPNNTPLPVKAAQRAHAPLYLVMYPESSSVHADSLNCQPTNCDHVQSFPGYPNGVLKGHDHLVGLPHTGDWNVAWDVVLVAFTQKGFDDGAINTRILTLDQLNAALSVGNVIKIGPVTNFHCSRVSPAIYLKATPLSFTVP